MGHRHLTVGRPLLVRLFRPEGASLLNFETEESTFITGRERLIGSSPTQANLQKGAGYTSERALCVCVWGGVSSRKGLMLCSSHPGTSFILAVSVFCFRPVILRCTLRQRQFALLDVGFS